MIAIEDVENHIVLNTNEKMVSCLRLSGFQTFVDYTIFNETTVNWIEKYIGLRCRLMTPDQRKFYIDDDFIDSPETFMFQVPLRHRLLKSVFELHCESKKIMEDIENVKTNNIEVIKPSSPLDESDNLDDISDTASDKLPNDSIKSESYLETNMKRDDIKSSTPNNSEIVSRFYSDIIEFASEEFIECYLEPNVDFNLTLPDFNTEYYRPVGRYHCLACYPKKRSSVMFKFRTDNKIQFTKIKKHLSEHYTANPDASEIRKQNRSAKRTNVIRKRKHSINNDFEIPNEMLIASNQIIPTKIIIPNNRKKIVHVFNEILPKNKQIIQQTKSESIKVKYPIKTESIQSNCPIKTEEVLQSNCPNELILSSNSEVNNFVIEEQNENIYETFIHEPVDTVEVVIHPAVTEDNQNFTDSDLSDDSDLEESALTICL